MERPFRTLQLYDLRTTNASMWATGCTKLLRPHATAVCHGLSVFHRRQGKWGWRRRGEWAVVVKSSRRGENINPL
jgi:hypothetical protein